ncbi:MAG TPA: phage tail sheath C-terminal domain-containing protein [Saprospiraceae bacterium]|nr:phage tail sheath C-terminal domain-containing protein [Saprospiraceae bacterium]
MAASYKTPGVYVEEIPKFPPSIAAVETAIPAFIGYTEKASRNGTSLHLKPTRIESIAEYEAYFGGGPSQAVTIELDASNAFVSAAGDAEYYLYDSLRMFYANGGGNCYILSVGTYEDAISASAISAALVHLEIEDEPTIILAPDAVSDEAGLYNFQQAALAQCNKLMDRVCIFDLRKADEPGEPTDFRDTVTEFRTGIGINYLKYGAAYGPWIRASLPRNIMHRDITLERGGAIALSSLTTDADILALIGDLMAAEASVDGAVAAEDALSASDDSLEARLTTLIAAYNPAAIIDDTSAEAMLQPIIDFAANIIQAVEARYDAAPTPATSQFKLRQDISDYVTNAGITGALDTLARHNAAAGFAIIPPASAEAFFNTTVTGGYVISALPVATGYVNDATVDAPIAFPHVIAFAMEAIGLFRFMQSALHSYEKTLNDALQTSFGMYKELVAKAGEALNLLPPSGLIAGVYAATDRSRGVWKAPANVSLNAVVGPAIKISHEQQGEYNVDVNAGKSINIIRAFTGKGTLVWGARTLAGNDSEWRYVNVRRFFNFVEESVKKATEQFVFEPNDANTWVKLQAMIENFLTTLWRQGALQGVKPEHAFYVAVGLGKTMTPLDILEGRLIIEIGMAAVRPAEFIILKFSHKMAES